MGLSQRIQINMPWLYDNETPYGQNEIHNDYFGDDYTIATEPRFNPKLGRDLVRGEAASKAMAEERIADDLLSNGRFKEFYDFIGKKPPYGKKAMEERAYDIGEHMYDNAWKWLGRGYEQRAAMDALHRNPSAWNSALKQSWDNFAKHHENALNLEAEMPQLAYYDLRENYGRERKPYDADIENLYRDILREKYGQREAVSDMYKLTREYKEANMPKNNLVMELYKPPKLDADGSVSPTELMRKYNASRANVAANKNGNADYFGTKRPSAKKPSINSLKGLGLLGAMGALDMYLQNMNSADMYDYLYEE